MSIDQITKCYLKVKGEHFVKEVKDKSEQGWLYNFGKKLWQRTIFINVLQSNKYKILSQSIPRNNSGQKKRVVF